MRISRVLPLALVLTVTQVTLLPQLRILGVVPDLGVVLAGVLGVREGSEVGAIAGFAAGVGYDLFLTPSTPVGANALSYAVVGWIAGYLHGAIVRRSPALPPFIGAAAGLLGGTIFLVVCVLSGVDRLQSVAALLTVVRAALYDTLVAPVVWLLCGLVLGEGGPAHSYRR